jgi:hypothetical protein
VRIWLPDVRDAENDPQRRSQSPVSLQRTPRVRFSRRAPYGLVGMSF